MNEIKRGEMYYANLCPVVGSEQGGIRPVLVIQNNIGNKFSPTIIVAPITSKEKKNQVTHVMVSGSGLSESSIVLLEQIRTIDKARLGRRIGMLSGTAMNQIDKAIVCSFGIQITEEIQHEQKQNCR